MIGEKLGPYEIISSIGSGGMGEVWKARDTRLGRIVAIKKVKEQHSERFKQEARTIAALNHPNICQIHDIGDDYLVLEYVEGKPLSSPLPEQETVKLAIQIATALEEAHQHGIIHRDLKPSNIMVTDKNSVKLLDFGLAKLYEQHGSISNLPTEDVPATQAGAILGTVAYMSPEQAQGQRVDVRSDIFSFGLVLYEMLSGKRAFTGSSAPEIMAALLRDQPSPLKRSPSLERIVKKCLEKNPSERYQTISEVKAALEKAVQSTVTISSEESRPSIAVLPFADMSPGKDNEWFSDGLAEEIINALTKIPNLKVIARTSAFAFKGKEQDIRRIAEALDVSNILEGSVRKAGDKIRITAQFIKAEDGSHLWSERYDRDMNDVFEIQDEIATAITNALQTKLSVTKLARQRYEPNIKAHEAYLKARYFFGKGHTSELCRDYFEQAITLDPQYALAQCGYADYFLFSGSAGFLPAREAMSMVRKEALRALAIDPLIPEAHAMLGIVNAICDYDWKEAKHQFNLAMENDPIPSCVHQQYGYFFLLPLGKTMEAIERIEQGLRDDPLNIPGQSSLAAALLIAGRTEEARVVAEKILDLDEKQPIACAILSISYAVQMKWERALYYTEKGLPVLSDFIGLRASVLKHLGQDAKAKEIIEKLLQGDDHQTLLGLFIYYYLCGENDVAMDYLKRAIEQRVANNPMYVALFARTNIRWPEIAKLMKLPEEAL